MDAREIPFRSRRFGTEIRAVRDDYHDNTVLEYECFVLFSPPPFPLAGACSHLKSIEYFAYSILEADEFEAFKCPSWDDFENNRCAGPDETANMGEHVDQKYVCPRPLHEKHALQNVKTVAFFFLF